MAKKKGGRLGSFVELFVKNIAKIDKIVSRYIDRLDGNEEGSDVFAAVQAVKSNCSELLGRVEKLPATFVPRKKTSQGVIFVPKMKVVVKEDYAHIYQVLANKTDMKSLTVAKIVGEGRGAKVVVRIGEDGDRYLGALPKGHLLAG